MTVFHRELAFSTAGDTDVHDLTTEVETSIAQSGIWMGTVTVSAVGSTAGITTIEYESGLVRDLKCLCDDLAPRRHDWAHNLTWGDGNGHSHLRASLIGPSISLPIVGGALRRGTWQQIVFIDFDTRPRDRAVEIIIMGEPQ